MENVTQLETYRQDYPISAEAPANTTIKLLSKRCGFKRGKRNTLIVSDQCGQLCYTKNVNSYLTDPLF